MCAAEAYAWVDDWAGWHIGHHLRRGQSVDDAHRYLRGHVRHVHFAAQPDAEHVSDADNRRTFELLAADGFTGFLSVEIIDPDDPDAVLGHHMRKFTEFMEAVSTEGVDGATGRARSSREAEGPRLPL